MKSEDRAYIELQKHLDRQAVGFPATRSRAEIKILKHIFTPLEARIAACLSYRPETVETIYRRAWHLVESPESLTELLGAIQRKGGIETRTKDGVKHYCNTPLVVGMYEMQLERLTPEFLEDFDRYIRDQRFGVEFLGTRLPQMRTIPVSASIRPEHNVSTFDEVNALLDRAEGPFAVIECICRKKKALENTPCKVTRRRDTCMAIGNLAQIALTVVEGSRELSKDRALTILEQNQQEGLVLQPSNTESADFICSCCGCCCGMLELHQILPKPLEFWSSNFQAAVDANRCRGCGACRERCQVKAVSAAVENRPAVVDRDRCFGCGVCVPACPEKAISLFKKPAETRPPQTRDELYDIIMAGRKSRLEKLKLRGRLLFDAIRTGRTELLKMYSRFKATGV